MHGRVEAARRMSAMSHKRQDKHRKRVARSPGAAQL